MWWHVLITPKHLKHSYTYIRSQPNSRFHPCHGTPKIKQVSVKMPYVDVTSNNVCKNGHIILLLHKRRSIDAWEGIPSFTSTSARVCKLFKRKLGARDQPDLLRRSRDNKWKLFMFLFMLRTAVPRTSVALTLARAWRSSSTAYLCGFLQANSWVVTVEKPWSLLPA